MTCARQETPEGPSCLSGVCLNKNKIDVGVVKMAKKMQCLLFMTSSYIFKGPFLDVFVIHASDLLK